MSQRRPPLSRHPSSCVDTTHRTIAHEHLCTIEPRPMRGPPAYASAMDPLDPHHRTGTLRASLASVEPRLVAACCRGRPSADPGLDPRPAPRLRHRADLDRRHPWPRHRRRTHRDADARSASRRPHLPTLRDGRSSTRTTGASRRRPSRWSTWSAARAIRAGPPRSATTTRHAPTTVHLRDAAATTRRAGPGR